jgi:putative two-component system response regulator
MTDTDTANHQPIADILIVDDTPANLQLLANILKEEGYKVRPAINGSLALRAVTQKKPDLILLDIKMPDMDGYQVCKALKENPASKDIPVIFISALSDANDKVKAFKMGGVDYLTKPFQLEEVKARVATHLQLNDYQNNLAAKVAAGVKEIKLLNQEIVDTQREVIVMLGSICEGHSLETSRHVKRVAAYSHLLAQHCDIEPEDIELIKQAAPMHDIGKIAIPDAILEKIGPFTPEEWETMKTHTTLGYQMLCYSSRPLFKMAATIAFEHHEKWNGCGYPRGLKEDQIHIAGRLTAIADVFDALDSNRCYKKGWELNAIVNFIKEQRGQHFDPTLVDIFFANLDDFLAIRNQFMLPTDEQKTTNLVVEST